MSTRRVRCPFTGQMRRIKPIRVVCGDYKKQHRRDHVPIYDTALAKTVADAGGVLRYAKLSAPMGENGGCGSPTYVEGTNGGKMPCGSMLTRFGVTAPYYCALCKPGPAKET